MLLQLVSYKYLAFHLLMSSLGTYLKTISSHYHICVKLLVVILDSTVYSQSYAQFLK